MTSLEHERDFKSEAQAIAKTSQVVSAGEVLELFETTFENTIILQASQDVEERQKAIKGLLSVSK